MKPKLARIFIEKNIIQRGSVIESYYRTKGISGQCNAEIIGSFRVIGAQAIGDKVYFDTLGPDDSRYRLKCENIISLDGMPLERVAQSHRMNMDGEPNSDKRRGRRKKSEIALIDSDFESDSENDEIEEE